MACSRVDPPTTPTLERLLECPICLDELREARILPCMHSMCLACLQQYVALNPTDGATDSVCCPTCRKECQIPRGGVHAFTKNFFVNSLQQHLSQSQVGLGAGRQGAAAVPDKGLEGLSGGATSTIKECHNNTRGGQHGEVVVFCVECDQRFCQHCADSHALFDATRHHALRPSDEVEQKAEIRRTLNPQCKNHGDQKLALYCKTCHAAVCSMCCLLSHKHHDYLELASAARECVPMLEEVLEESAKYIAHLDNIAKDLDQTRATMISDFKSIRSDIQTAINDVCETAVEKGKLLMEKVEGCEEEAMMVVNSAQKENDIRKANLQSLQSYAQGLTAYQEQLDKVVFTYSLVEQLHHQQSIAPYFAQWNVLKTTPEKKTDPLSRVAGIAVALASTTGSTAAGKIDRGDSAIQLKEPVRTIPLRCSMIAPAFVITGNVLITVHWGDPHLWIYSLDGTFIKSCKVSGLRYAAGMSLLPSSDTKILVTDYHAATLYVVTLSANLDIKSQRTKKVSFAPRRVCLDTASNELILANNSDKQIVILDSEARIKRKIPLDGNAIWSLWCVAKVKDSDRYMLTDSGNNTVLWTDSSGAIVHTYGEERGEYLQHPCHLVNDGRGGTIVVDHMNDGIHLLNADRTFQQHLLTNRDDIVSPTSVYLDEQAGLLYVCHGVETAPEVRVYKYPTAVHSVMCHTTRLQLSVRL